MKNLGPAASLGTNMTAGMLLCSYIGYRLDKRFGREDSLFTLCGMFFGLIYCGYEVWKLTRLQPDTATGDDEGEPDN